jgi:hypothetical protein
MDIVAEHDIAQAVSDAVAAEQVIDLHTHLFPPSHGALMLWGCDALLTYHYLLAEYFISALNPPSPESFYRFARARVLALLSDALAACLCARKQIWFGTSSSFETRRSARRAGACSRVSQHLA